MLLGCPEISEGGRDVLLFGTDRHVPMREKFDQGILTDRGRN